MHASMTRLLSIIAACFLITAVPGLAAAADVITGSIVMAREAIDTVTWGDGIHNLSQGWSIALFDTSGWFYGSAYSNNVDVFNAGRVDPATISNAEAFPYTSAAVQGFVGETIFFRGTNGYYGAWTIDEIRSPSHSGAGGSYLNGTWYFQANGTGNFVPGTNVNSFVTLNPLSATYRTLSDTTGCPAGFSGKFTFTGLLTNKSTSPSLLALKVRVTTLTNGNLLQDPRTNALLGGQGAIMPVPADGMYADGLLGPAEAANVPFVVCLKARQPFQLFVNVLGSSGTITVLPYLSNDYKYSIVPSGQGNGFEQPAFNDSSFSTGHAAFGTAGFPCPLDFTIRTYWPPNTDLLLRKQFKLDAIPQSMTIGVAIDNDVQVFVNGQDVSGGVRTHEGCATRDFFVFPVPTSILKRGNNLVAVRAIDRGSVAYVDIEIKATYP
jgi:hypothetical protein